MDRAAARAMKDREESFNPFVTCYETAGCQKMDMNLVCNTNLTVAGDTGKCECRHDMRWNEKSGECQLYLVQSRNCNIDTLMNIHTTLGCGLLGGHLREPAVPDHPGRGGEG